MPDPRHLLTNMFRTAINAAAPAACVPPHLPPPPAPPGRTIVIGAGKASAAMARALEEHWPPHAALSGLVVTRYGHTAPCSRIEIIEAAHPVPDAASESAAARMLEMVGRLAAHDLVIALMSGGGSALLAAPGGSIGLAEKQAISRALLRSGASIHEMNCVRKHLSAVKGGRLGAAAWPARTVTLVISDVPGDDPAIVASGPTLGDSTTRLDAIVILQRYGIAVSDAAAHWLAGEESETIKPDDQRLAHNGVAVVATAAGSLAAAATFARENGVTPVILGDAIEGEARDVARHQAEIALSCAVPRPCVLLSGGETTVTVRGTGRGGRNLEYLLSLGIALQGHPRIHALAADTDGIDGTEHNAGGIVSPDFLERCAARGIDPSARLNDNDGYSVFEALGDLVVTGPTLTNVNDFRAILIA